MGKSSLSLKKRNLGDSPLSNFQFEKVKKDAHEVQIGEYEQYQSQEVIELTKVIQVKQQARISNLTTEFKDHEELTEKLAELQAKLDKEALTRRKQVRFMIESPQKVLHPVF